MSEDLSKALKRISLDSSTKRTFAFSRPAFDGRKFFNKYKNATFVNNNQNIFTILAKTNELQEHYDEMEPDDEFVVDGMFVQPNVPLVLKKSATIDESDVHQDDFTLRRLSGLAAAVARQKHPEFLNVYAVDAERHKIPKPHCKTVDPGYSWEKKVYYGFKHYLAAVTGAEFFVDEFDYYPFLMALKRFNLKQIEAPLLISIAEIRHFDTQEPIAVRCYRDYTNAVTQARNYDFDLQKALQAAPKEVQLFFQIGG